MKIDCGDNSCFFLENGKGGMRTNGGCRCFDKRPAKIEMRKRLTLYNKMVEAFNNIEFSHLPCGEWELTYLDTEEIMDIKRELKNED